MEVKKRNPFLHLMIVVLTFGQYGFLWPFLMARDINRIQGKKKIEIKKNGLIFGTLYSVYLVGYIFLIVSFLTRSGPTVSVTKDIIFFSVFIIGITLMILFLRLLLKIGKEIRELTNSENPGGALIVLTTLFYLVSLPVLQSCLNKGISHNKTLAINSGAGAPPLWHSTLSE